MTSPLTEKEMEPNDQAFDQGLKHILENPPPGLPNEASMQAMYERLSEEDRGGRLLRWPRLLWAALIAIPLLLGFTFLYQQIHTAKQRIHELELLLTQQSHLSDTTFQHQVIYQYDTLVEVVYIKEKRVVPISSPSLPPLFSYRPLSYAYSPSPDYFPPSIQRNRRWSLPTGSSSSSTGYYRNPFLEEHLFTDSDSHFGNLDSGNNEAIYGLTKVKNAYKRWIPEIPDPNPSIKPVPHPPAPRKRKGLHLDLLFASMSPTGSSIGLDLNPISYLMPEGHRGIGGGLNGALAYGDHLRFRVGAHVTRIRYEERDEARIALYPPGMPRNSEDRLKELYATLGYLEMSLGAEYLLRQPSQTWRPYFGATALWRAALSQNLRYEYISSTDTDEYYTTGNAGSTPVSFAGMRLSAGMTYRLNRRLGLRSGVHYTFDLRDVSSQPINLNRMGIRLGVEYGLK